jgi:cobalt/nickel transport system permease protein
MARKGFLERTIAGLHDSLDRSLRNEHTAQAEGFLQRRDPRAKLIAALLLICAVVASRSLLAIGVVLLLATAMAPWRVLVMRVWPGVLAFAVVIGGPAVFLVPEHGWRSFLLLTARMLTTVTLSYLLVSTTPWTHVLKAMRTLRVPVVFVVLLGMAYRFIYLLLGVSLDMYQARRSRMVGPLATAERRRMTAANAGVLVSKTHQLSNDVYLAMLSRGYRGEVRMLDSFRMLRADWWSMACCTALAVIVAGVGR